MASKNGKRPDGSRKEQTSRPQRAEKSDDDSRRLAESIVNRRMGALRELAKH